MESIKAPAMTALEACDIIEQAINELHEETRNEGWDWAYTDDLTDEGHIDNLRDTLRKTREHFELPEKTSMWFVSTNPSNSVLAFCGNSSTAIDRARYLSWVNPQNVMLLINRLRELESRPVPNQ